MLQGPRQIVAVAEVKIAIQIDICEHSQISLFQWVCLLHRRLAHTDHNRIFDCINYVLVDNTTFCSFGHQNHVIALHETNETQHAIRTNFLECKKKEEEEENDKNRNAISYRCFKNKARTLHCPNVPTKFRMPLASYSLGYSWNFSSVRWVRSISRQRNFVSRSLLPTNNKR